MKRPLTCHEIRTFIELKTDVPLAMTEKYVVLSFSVFVRGLASGQMRAACNAAGAEKVAAALLARHIGFLAHAIQADMESGV